MTGSDAQNLYAVITYTNHSGIVVQETIAGTDFTTSISSGVERWVITVYDLAVPDGDTVIKCTIYDADGNELAWGEDSMNFYLCRAINGSQSNAKALNLYTMTRRFTQSAYTKFHPNK